MPSPTAATWVKFFSNADIPSPAAATYAHVFVENRIQMDMLMDLNKEYLREMGITTMGDIIAILRHAKKVAEQSAREKVLSVPENEPGVPVATVSGTPNTGTVSQGKKTEKPGLKPRTVSSPVTMSNESKPRRVLPEHEGKYKIILPTGSTARSREILDKKEAKPTSSVDEKPPARAGVKRGSIFDRLSNDNEPPAKFTPPVQKGEPMGLTISSSIFSRLGGRTVTDNGIADVGATSAGILKKSTGKLPSVAPDLKYNPSDQKVILVKKIPAKAVAVLSEEEDLDDYPRLTGYGVDASVGGGLKSVSFSEEDEVLEIAPRKVSIQGDPGGSPGARHRFSEDAVSVKQRLGGGGAATNVGAAGVKRSPSLHGTKNVVQMKRTSYPGAGGKLSLAHTSLKSDNMMHVRKQPIKNRLSLGTRTDTKSLSTRVERFSLDSKLAKVGKGAGKSNGSVFDRLGYNLLRFGKGFEVLYGAVASIELKHISQQLFIVLGKLSSGLFLLADHVVWLSRSGVSKNVNTTKWLNRSNRFWLISILMNLCRDLQELYRLFVYYSRSNIRNLQQALSVIYQENKPLLVDTVKNDWDNIANALTKDELPEGEDEDMDTVEALEEKMSKVQRGMFVSGWDDPDDLVEEDKDPQATLERYALWAAGENKLEIVENIVKRKPSVVHAVDNDGYTALHKACYNDNPTMAKILLRYGADPMARTAMGWTPLHSACKWNNAACVALVLQHGADVNARSDGDQTPLHIACTVSDCRSTLMTLLMNEECDPERRNNSNETAEQIAKRSGLSYTLFQMAHPAFRVETGMID
uniref:Uncharacterized protein n=1 Tax=Anopheles atroparvus TaxID=41427 RepID=A0A182J4C9_ANOAO